MEHQEKSGSDIEEPPLAPNLKKRDGIILMPQPSDDPHDPLNW